MTPVDRARSGSRSGGAEPDLPPLRGIVECVTYHNEETLYTVLKLYPDDGYEAPDGSREPLSGRVTAVGKLPRVDAGMRVELVGNWTDHKAHGPQFQLDHAEVLPPADDKGLIKYLASNAFKGIGEVTAARIVEKLGSNALERMLKEPEMLDGVAGLRADTAAALLETVRAQLGSHRTHAFLRGLGLGPWQTGAVIQKLGPGCEEELRANPYVLASRVHGIGFGTADSIAKKLGIDGADPRRLQAALHFALSNAARDGHTMQLKGRLFERAIELIGAMQESDFEDALFELASREEITLDSRRRVGAEDDEEEVLCYLPYLHTSEKRLASNLAVLARHGAATIANEEKLAKAEATAEIELHESQREAVLGLLKTPLGILTGGPGVGKTTIVQLLVTLAIEEKYTVLLASPTGRAAKRLAEATGREATTIHRMLGFDPQDGGFAHDAARPLEADIIIVDEISMLDVVLAHHLVQAIGAPSRLILVGDPDQLPSVGAGNVLADMLASKVVPEFRLTHIYRQAEGSLIVANANRILTGERPELPERGDHGSDFYFFPAEDADGCAKRLVDVVSKRIPETFGFDWMEDVQVIAPMYRGSCGVDTLNRMLREAQGIGGTEIRRGDRIWRIGDRVIHTRNDYEKEIFNGDMGRITEVFENGGLTVEFPDREPIAYTTGELNDLQPAYAITVHRSQGCEYPVVVFPLVTQHYMMLQRHLLYTAITRARSLVVLVGSQKALDMALSNADQRERESALGQRLRAEFAS